MALGLFLVFPSTLKLSAVSILFALFMVEAGYRVHDYNLSQQYPKEEEEEASVIPMYDALLGWKMRPNIEVHFSNKANRFRTMVKTNSKGLRDDECEYPKQQGVKRILLLGDSVIAGLEVEKYEVLDKRLEVLLARHGTYEVINAGVRGYGTDQSLLYLQEEGYKYAPDIIIYVFVNNDPMENVAIHKPHRRFGKAYFKRVGDELVLNGVPVPRDFDPKDRWLMSDAKVQEAYNKAEERSVRGVSFVSTVRDEASRLHVIAQLLNSIEFGTIRSWLELLGFYDRPFGMGGMWPYREPKPRFVEDFEWDMTERLIAKMKRFSESRNAKFIIYESSSSGSHNTKPTRLEDISGRQGVPYFNSFEDMYEASKGGRLFSFPLDVHWNAKGHNFVAEAMHNFLQRNGFLEETSSLFMSSRAS